MIGHEIYLVECLIADVTFVRLLTRVGQTVVLVVSLLMESLPTELTHPGLVAVVDPHVGVEGGAPVERLPTGQTLVRLLVGVDDLVPAEGRGLSESFTADLADKRSGPCNIVTGWKCLLVWRDLPVCTGMCLVRL